MGNAAARNGVRFRYDLLASGACLAKGRRLAQAAPRAAGQSTWCRQARFFPCRCRQFVGTCCAWGKKSGPNPTDRRKAGSKHHLLVDAQGIPVNVILTKANRHDVTQLLPLVDGVYPIRGKRGRPLKKPKSVQADRAYDTPGDCTFCESRPVIPECPGIRLPSGMCGTGTTAPCGHRSNRLRHLRLPEAPRASSLARPGGADRIGSHAWLAAGGVAARR
jgi:hypothetical protein